MLSLFSQISTWCFSFLILLNKMQIKSTFDIRKTFRARRSFVWHYFRLESINKASNSITCSLCLKETLYANNSTSTLLYHLTQNHGIRRDNFKSFIDTNNFSINNNLSESEFSDEETTYLSCQINLIQKNEHKSLRRKHDAINKNWLIFLFKITSLYLWSCALISRISYILLLTISPCYNIQFNSRKGLLFIIWYAIMINLKVMTFIYTSILFETVWSIQISDEIQYVWKHG